MKFTYKIYKMNRINKMCIKISIKISKGLYIFK